jgi:hypothetical protein
LESGSECCGEGKNPALMGIECWPAGWSLYWLSYPYSCLLCMRERCVLTYFCWCFEIIKLSFILPFFFSLVMSQFYDYLGEQDCVLAMWIAKTINYFSVSLCFQLLRNWTVSFSLNIKLYFCF